MKEDREHIMQFFVRLCSIIAGIVVISGLLNRLILFTIDCLVKNVSPEAYAKLKKPSAPYQSERLIQNKILLNANDVPIVPLSLTMSNN